MFKIFIPKMPFKFDRGIHTSVCLLSAFGLIMIGSASASEGVKGMTNLLIKQSMFFVIGYFAMSFLARYFDVRKSRKYVDMVYVVIVILMFVAFAFFEPLKDTRAWIRINDFTIQPSEFFKVILIVELSYCFNDLMRVKRREGIINYGIKKPLIYTGIGLILIFLQKDFGTLLITIMIASGCFLSAQAKTIKMFKRLYLLVLAGGTALGLILGPMILGFTRFKRITILFNPFAERLGHGFQLTSALLAMQRGGLFGAGFGRSFFKNGYIPEAHNDFIVAIIIEELGLIGFLAVVIGYGIIISRLLSYAIQLKDERGRIILIGGTLYLVIHFLVNVGGVTGLIPMTGVPLTFVSYGGSSLWSIMMMMGLCQSVIAKYRQGVIE